MNLNNDAYRKQLTPLLIYLFVSFLLVALSTVRFFDPIYTVTDDLSAGARASLYNLGTNINAYTAYFADSAHYIAENQALQKQLYSLQSVEADNLRLQNENDVLRKQLGIPLPVKKKMILSLVISRSSLLDTIVINQGSDAGVTKDAVVVYQNILIGRIIDVSARSAKVQLISSVDSSVPVVVDGTSINGVLQGSLTGLTMGDILPDENVNVGATVVSSGLGGIYPNGLLVGKVGSVQGVTSDPFKAASVFPALDITTISYVFVLGE